KQSLILVGSLLLVLYKIPIVIHAVYTMIWKEVPE
ncbi:hypothetical protein C8N37_107180, partial [Sphingobacterium faecium]